MAIKHKTDKLDFRYPCNLLEIVQIYFVGLAKTRFLFIKKPLCAFQQNNGAKIANKSIASAGDLFTTTIILLTVTK